MRKTKLAAIIIGTVLVAILIVATTLWIKRGSDDAKIWRVTEVEEPVTERPTETMESVVGTLSITPTLEDTKDATNYWIYVNGRIVATRESPQDDPSSLDTFSILLVPGEYTVEVAVPATLGVNNSNFPLEFRKQKVKVEAGKLAEAKIDVKYSSELAMNMGWGGKTGETWGEWYARLLKEVEDTMKNFQQDPAVIAIKDVYVALQQSPPLRPVVYINMLESCYGGREYDAQQVSRIVDWLKITYWSWFPPWELSQRKVMDNMPATIREKYDQLLKVS